MLGNVLTSLICRRGGADHADYPGRAVPVPVGIVGRAGGLPADDRRGAGRDPDHLVRCRALTDAGVITLVVFLAYTQIENHVLHRSYEPDGQGHATLLVLISILVGASLGSWIGRHLRRVRGRTCSRSRPAGAIQVMIRELWQAPDPDRASPAPPETTA